MGWGGGIIVLEDDVFIETESFLSAAKECLRSPWECVRLYEIAELPLKRIAGNFFTYKRGGGGTQGYFLRESAAKKFLGASRKWTHPVDIFMDRYWHHGVAYVVRKPFVLKETEIPSEIDSADGVANRKETERRLWTCPLRYVTRLCDKVKKRFARRRFSVLFFGDLGEL